MSLRINLSKNNNFEDLYFMSRNSDQSIRFQMYKNDLKYVNSILNKLQFKNPSFILDVGCADGTFSKLILDEYSCQVHGIELNTKQRILASKIIDKTYKSLSDLDLLEKYDVIILRGTLHYLTETEVDKILKLSSNGCVVFFLQNPNRNSLPFRLSGSSKIKFITPHEDFTGNTLIYNRKILGKRMATYNFHELSFSFPYFTTPYFKPFKDIRELIKLLILRNSQYHGSLPGNVFRSAYFKK
jgi:2-polyprenyl-3-methyl-5-hydroxy-6-metoxy-1,4-benzoquinol methylase